MSITPDNQAFRPTSDEQGRNREAVEFIDVHKAFGRNQILCGVNLGLPEGKISMILGPSGTGKSVCIKHMVGCCTQTRATCSCMASRYREERRRGLRPADALASTYRSTGMAVLASAATVIAGFAVLVVSDIRMLRDFGFVTVIDLTVSLAGVLLVLPATMLLAERRGRRARL
ncbi:MAG: MMPL family transporter [Solirubrobacteraceae bacterium]